MGKRTGNPRGRPRNARNKRKAVELERLAKGGEMPLDYALRIMRDPNTTKARADKFCLQAMPYCHARLMPQPAEGKPPAKGKKEEAAAAAENAGKGTKWGSDLDTPSSPAQH